MYTAHSTPKGSTVHVHYQSTRSTGHGTLSIVHLQAALYMYTVKVHLHVALYMVPSIVHLQAALYLVHCQ